MSTVETPNVHLRLRNRPENVALVRTMLTGVAEAIDLDGAVLDDIRTAVTEACNNVVLHAYRGDEGALDVDVHLLAGAIEVVVRDEGVGLRPQASGADDRAVEPDELDLGSLELGLSMIESLATHVELRRRTQGTEVRIEFAIPGTRRLDAPGDDFEFPPAELPLLELLPAQRSQLIAAVAIAITPARLARTVLPRLVYALAARASFSTDRLSDAQLLADVIAAQAFQSIIGSYLGVGVAVEPRQVELRIGPLSVTGDADEADAAPVLGELARVIEKLIDNHSLATFGPGKRSRCS